MRGSQKAPHIQSAPELVAAVNGATVGEENRQRACFEILEEAAPEHAPRRERYFVSLTIREDERPGLSRLAVYRSIRRQVVVQYTNVAELPGLRPGIPVALRRPDLPVQVP